MTKKNKIVVGSIIGGVVVLGAIGSAAGGSDNDTSSNSSLNSESSYVSTIESDISDDVSSLVISAPVESTSAESSDIEQEKISEPRETASGKSDKSVDGIMTIKAVSVRNDKTGNWRYSAFSESGLDISEYALSYYKEYFKADKEIHAVINFADKTTTRINCSGEMLFVTVYEYVDGEEHDADLMFSGNIISDYIVYTDNGDVEVLDTPEPKTIPAPPETTLATTTTTPKPQSTITNTTAVTTTTPPPATTPKAVTYVLNTSTLKVHKPSCRDVDKIAAENYDTTTDLQNVINKGYTACGHCHPF